MTTVGWTLRAEARAESRTLAIISSAHLVSHFYWLAFVPLLPLFKATMGVSYVELGLALTVMNVVSVLTQAPCGFLVDRWGARALLIGGLIIGGLAFAMLAVAPTYPMLIVAAVLIGLANAVYHPADYSILSAEMSAGRMGGAYSIHTFAGYLGFAIVPPVLLAASRTGGLAAALWLCAALAPLAAAPLLPGVRQERARSRTRQAAGAEAGHSARSLLTPTILALLLMFATLNLSTNMLQTYMVVALGDVAHASQNVAEWALTSFLFALVLGVLFGGVIADRIRSPGLVSAAGFTLAAALVALVALLRPQPALALSLVAAAGFLAGIIMPSRDMLVRDASPAGAVGRVFGIVTTGFNLGGMAGPLIGGLAVDRHASAWIFYGSSLCMLATVAIALAIDRAARAGR